MKQPKIVLGFVGKICAGKGVSIEYLVKNHNFIASSCSDRIREEIRRKGEEINRKNLQQTSWDLKQKFGPTVLAKKTWQNLIDQEMEKVAIDSIRATEEVRYLKLKPNFYLVAIEANQRLRFERLLKRHIKGQKEPTTWEEFVKVEKRDNTGDGRNIQGCINLADFKIVNEGTFKDLYQNLEEILKKINNEGKN